MTNPNPQTESAALEPRKRSEEVRRTVNAIARDLVGGFGPSDVAALRRLRPEDPSCSAFWRVCATHLEPLLPERNELRNVSERRWAVVLNAMAILEGLHAPGVPLGRALAEADVAEQRVVRLLRAQGDLLEEVLRTVAHQLASRAAVSDHTDLAFIALSSDGEPWGDDVRRRVARDYYSAVLNTKPSRSEGETP